MSLYKRLYLYIRIYMIILWFLMLMQLHQLGLFVKSMVNFHSCPIIICVVMVVIFAIRNGLNYLVFWNCDLTDFHEWLYHFNDTHVLKQY